MLTNFEKNQVREEIRERLYNIWLAFAGDIVSLRGKVNQLASPHRESILDDIDEMEDRIAWLGENIWLEPSTGKKS